MTCFDKFKMGAWDIQEILLWTASSQTENRSHGGKSYNWANELQSQAPINTEQDNGQ